MTTESQALLGDLRTLRARARADQRGYAFPLFLIGGLILFAPVLYSPLSVPGIPPEKLMTFPVDQGPFPQFTPRMGRFENAWLVDYYWILVIVGGLAATGWWYRQRARRLGVEANIAVTYAAAGATLFGVLVGSDLLELVVADDFGTTLYSAPWINLPILFGTAILSAVTFYWGSRPARTSRQRTATTVAGTLLATVAVSALCVYFFMGYAELVVIAVALLALAWWERSVLLGVVATLFTAMSVPANHSLWQWDLPYVFDQWGWHSTTADLMMDTRVHAWQTLLVPGLLLVAGGAIAALTRHGANR
jgi:hypothetical protein